MASEEISPESGGVSAETSPEVRARLTRRGFRLEYATFAWNGSEAFIAIFAGIKAGSLALAAFGISSFIEVFAGGVVIWHMRGETGELRPKSARSRRAIFLIGLAFALFGVAVLLDAIRGLVARERPDPTTFGIVYMALTVIVMFWLGVAKHRVGKALGNAPLVANASLTILDGCQASGVLAALILNAVAGFWWVDMVVAGGVGVLAIREGYQDLRLKPG